MIPSNHQNTSNWPLHWRGLKASCVMKGSMPLTAGLPLEGVCEFVTGSVIQWDMHAMYSVILCML